MAHFEMCAGDTRRINISLVDQLGAPMSIADCTVRWQASRGTAERFSATPLITKTIGAGIEVTDEFGGRLTVHLAPSDTENLAGDFYHELELRDATGDVSTPIRDTFTLLRNLIR